jgi:N-acyl-D-aspartate/D-glutamate deacylase
LTPRVRGRALLAVLVVASACAEPDATRRDSADPTGSFDLLISGGVLVDGSGAPGRAADVLVRGDRIAFVGAVDPDTVRVRERFDADGLVVTPGYIDAHAHGDPTVEPAFRNFLAMGVTTIVLGQDGSSPEVAALPAQLARTDSAHPGVNIAYLVGHNTVRFESGIGYDDPGSEGMVRLSELVARGLQAGAFGLSTGLEYDPGSRASPDELAAIAAPVAEAGAVVSSHLRSEDADRVGVALTELIDQGRRSGARVHVSHIKIVLESDTLAAAALLHAMARARDEGIAVTADIYPYTASFTGLSILFPEWARPPNDYDRVVRDRRDELAGWLRQRVESRNGPTATLIGTGEWAGRTLAEAAAEQGVPFEEVLIELGPDGASAAYFVMDEAVMRTLLRDPSVVGSSDGSPSMLHPRGYGSFPRVIREYVVLDTLLSLEDAIRTFTGAAAAVYRLDDVQVSDPPRGLLRAGWAADILAFDPAEVRDAADFEHPHRLAEGLRRVWVNGELALRDGETARGPGHGRALRARWRIRTTDTLP